MGLPNIEVIFKAKASNAIVRGERGIVVLILKDTVPTTNPIVMNNENEIPTTGLSADNIAEIKRAWIGNVNQPIRVIAYIIAESATDYSAAQAFLETIKWDYIAVPEIEASETTAFANWIKACRDTKDLKVKAILPHCVADHEGIINFDTDGIVVGKDTLTGAQYCSRIAGMLAGTPLNMSATYAVLSEVNDVPHHTRIEFDTLIDAGKLVLYNDGEKVKIARAVNSLTTIPAGKTADFKKIKIVDIMDMIYSDITRTVNDNYIGKYANSYDSKIILITAIKAYLDRLENQSLLDKGQNSVGIDTDANKTYLISKNIDVSQMKEQEIKEANTDSKVYLTGQVKILDAMEDMTLNLYM